MPLLSAQLFEIQIFCNARATCFKRIDMHFYRFLAVVSAAICSATFMNTGSLVIVSFRLR